MPFLNTNSQMTTKPYNCDIKCQGNSESCDRHGFQGGWGQNFLLTVGSFYNKREYSEADWLVPLVSNLVILPNKQFMIILSVVFSVFCACRLQQYFALSQQFSSTFQLALVVFRSLVVQQFFLVDTTKGGRDDLERHIMDLVMELVKHKIKKHQDERIHPCSTCDMSFRSLSVL